MRGAEKPQPRHTRIAGAHSGSRLEAPCRLVCNELQNLARDRLCWDSQALHRARLFGRPRVGAGSEPDLNMTVFSEQLRSTDFGKPARHLIHGRFNKGRQVMRVVRAMSCSRREAPRPWQKHRDPAQWNIERAAENRQFAPESEKEVRGGKRLYQLSGDVPGVSETDSRHPRPGTVEAPDGSDFARGRRYGSPG